MPVLKDGVCFNCSQEFKGGRKLYFKPKVQGFKFVRQGEPEPPDTLTFYTGLICEKCLADPLRKDLKTYQTVAWVQGEVPGYLDVECTEKIPMEGMEGK